MDVCSVHISLIVSQVALNAPIDLLSCFFYTFETFLRWKIAIGIYCVIAYCTLFVPLSFQQPPSETREAKISCSSISNFIFVVLFGSICLSLPPGKFNSGGSKKQTLTERFFSAWHVKLLFVITLFYSLSHSRSLCFLSPALASSLIHWRCSYRRTAITMNI